ncbi:MAG: hypothetical protein R3C59_08675 [Planctomycetaceae bacterium]
MAKIDARLIRTACTVALVSIAQFLVLVPLAISLYPKSYSLAANYLSQLGCVDGTGPAHAWAFNVSVVLLGLGLFCLFAMLMFAARRGPIELLVIGGFGSGSAISVIGVGVLPWNIYPTGHVLAMIFWMGLMLPMFAIWMEWVGHSVQDAEGLVAFGRSLRFLVFFYPMAALMMIGPGLQKVIVLLSLVWLVNFCVHLMIAANAGVLRTGFAGRKRKRTKLPPLPPGTFDGTL